MTREFRARCDLSVTGLDAPPGVRCFTPRGAFNVFPSFTGTGMKGAELAKLLL